MLPSLALGIWCFGSGVFSSAWPGRRIVFVLGGLLGLLTSFGFQLRL